MTSSDDVQWALDAYIEALTPQDDNSVTIAVIGYPMNIRDLLRYAHPLFEQKVKAVYFMNGFYNFGCAEGHWLGPDEDCHGAAKETLAKLNTLTSVKVYYQSNGSSMCTGGDFFHNKCGTTENPVK